MAIVIRCDICTCVIEREATGVTFVPTTRVVDAAGEARPIDSGEGQDQLLCLRCASYLDRCVRHLESAALEARA